MISSNFWKFQYILCSQKEEIKNNIEPFASIRDTFLGKFVLFQNKIFKAVAWAC